MASWTIGLLWIKGIFGDMVVLVGVQFGIFRFWFSVLPWWFFVLYVLYCTYISFLLNSCFIILKKKSLYPVFSRSSFMETKSGEKGE